MGTCRRTNKRTYKPFCMNIWQYEATHIGTFGSVAMRCSSDSAKQTCKYVSCGLCNTHTYLQILHRHGSRPTEQRQFQHRKDGVTVQRCCRFTCEEHSDAQHVRVCVQRRECITFAESRAVRRRHCVQKTVVSLPDNMLVHQHRHTVRHLRPQHTHYAHNGII